jgi:hypothetical protein
MFAGVALRGRHNKNPFDLGLNMRTNPAQFVFAHLVKALHFDTVEVRKERRLNSLHTDMPHEVDRVCRQVTATPFDMPADHRNKEIFGALWLKQVAGGKLGMICHGVCSTYLKLNPQSAASLPFGKQYICPRGVAEDGLKFSCQEAGFRLAIPTWWALRSKAFLKIPG